MLSVDFISVREELLLRVLLLFIYTKVIDHTTKLLLVLVHVVISGMIYLVGVILVLLASSRHAQTDS